MVTNGTPNGVNWWKTDNILQCDNTTMGHKTLHRKENNTEHEPNIK